MGHVIYNAITVGAGSVVLKAIEVGISNVIDVPIMLNGSLFSDKVVLDYALDFEMYG